HQSQPRNVHADADHVGRENGINSARGTDLYIEQVEHSADFFLRSPGCQFLDVAEGSSLLGASISIKRDAVGDVVLHEDERTSKLAKRVEVPDERPVGIPANIIAECPERCL